MVSARELAALRTQAIDVGTEGTGAKISGAAGAFPLVVRNVSDTPKVVLVDGSPIAWLRGGSQGVLPGLVRGRYQIQTRSFVGDEVDPAAITTAPGTYGAQPDGGP